jgi:sterol desaturase/sphingolipid hydroxylase (fatty acid hydroxylase superfamily)
MNAASLNKEPSNPRPVRYRYLAAAFIVYVPLTGYGFLWSAGTETPIMTTVGVIGAVCLGLFVWTLLEYVLHRFVHAGEEQSAIGKVITGLHMGHHRSPTHEAKVTTPVFGSLPVAAVCLAALRLAGATWQASMAVMAGIVAGYLLYEVIHFRIHCGSTHGRVIAYLRALHLVHHHQDRSRCFGVTSPLWDWVFGTRIVPSS